MSTCGKCKWFKFEQYCYALPPTIVSYLPAIGDMPDAWSSKYTPVAKDNLACSLFKSERNKK